VREFERAKLIERIERESATVGADIPERIELGDDAVDLRSFVFEIRRRETIPPGERDRVEDAKRSLRRARRERKDDIEVGDIDFERGEQIAREVIGIDRALEALEDLSASDVEAEAEASAAADRRRWMRFLRKALGHEEDSKQRGARHRGGPGP
jgi:hypothetical protein